MPKQTNFDENLSKSRKTLQHTEKKRYLALKGYIILRGRILVVNNFYGVVGRLR